MCNRVTSASNNPNNRPWQTEYKCTGCVKIYSLTHMKLVRISPTLKLTLCGSCLYNLMLELNDTFGMYTLIDGTATGTEYWNEVGKIPSKIIKNIFAGKKIKAIKDYREFMGFLPDDGTPEHYWEPDSNGNKVLRRKVTLKEAKAYIDKLEEKINRSKNYNEFDFI